MEFIEIHEFGSYEPVRIKTRCTHRSTTPVLLKLTGEHVATLCLDCDKQLPVTRQLCTKDGRTLEVPW